jgi:hypothetical protein
MRNRRELYRIRVENLNGNNRIIFVPDSKTADGRRMIPMSDRVGEVLRARAGGRSEGWLFPSNRTKCGHSTDVAKQISDSACEGRSSRGPRLVLQPTRLGYTGTEQHGKSSGGDEDDGAQGCESCHAVSTSGT